jgi:hypothetical protein
MRMLSECFGDLGQELVIGTLGEVARVIKNSQNTDRFLENE